jgi:hypothetical protein
MTEKNEAQLLQSYTLTQGCIGEKTYEVDDTFRPGANTFHGVHSVAEVVKLLESDSKIGFEGLFIATGEDGEVGAVRLTKEKFLEAWKKNSKKTGFKKMFESFNGGNFDTGANLVGQDYTPLLGGPFHKQLYLHDMLRMFALAFYASNHDPIAKALINITVDFTLGRGYRVDSKDKTALALWRAFEKVNKLPELMRHMAYGLCRDGEVMPWWMPNGMPFQEWQLSPEQTPPAVALPRVKLMDPSTCWEVITYPEDIDRVVAYQFVYPTQYNLYTAKDANADDQDVRSMKFIFQQIPAAQIDHFRVNRSSNEKRGRSDLYPAFGFLKRLRDTVEYSVIGMAKAAAWAIDTTVDGSPADIQNYLQDQQSKKTISPAGSEFIHSPKIKREYLSNDASKNGGSVSAFEWCLNMVCAAVQIPVSYLGTHLSGGQTKASAMVGTEPVTKKFEARQQVYERIVQTFWDRLMKMYGLEASCEITFPELISQDRSAKIKDLITAQEVGAIDHEYMSTTIAQELGNSTYDYMATQTKITLEKQKQLSKAADSVLISPLTALPTAPAGSPSPSGASAPVGSKTPSVPAPKPSKVTKTDRVNQRRNDTQ